MVVCCSTQWAGPFGTKFISLAPCVPLFLNFKGHRPQIWQRQLKIIKLDCFWHFLVVKRQVGYLVCAILVVLMETNRLVPWLRQSDHPIQKHHAPRAAGQAYNNGFSNFLKHLYWKVLVPIKLPLWTSLVSIN